MYDLKKYREAKALLPHLDMILKILNLTEKSLTYYKCYIPVKKILLVINTERKLLESYKALYDKEKQSKGEIK